VDGAAAGPDGRRAGDDRLLPLADASLPSAEAGGVPNGAAQDHGGQGAAAPVRRRRGRKARRAADKGQLNLPPVSVELTDAAFGGDAIGHLPDGRVVFVARGLPGEQAVVSVQEERR